jgi:hypothetical protein
MTHRKRNDRITDFWKTPHKLLRITYNPLNQYGIKQIDPGFTLCNVSATFYPLSDTTSASLYVKELNYPQDLADPEQKLSESILRTLVGPRPLDSEWKQIAEVTFPTKKDDLSPIAVPLPDLSGPKVLIFLSDTVRVSVHGTFTDTQDLFSLPTKADPEIISN